MSFKRYKLYPKVVEDLKKRSFLGVLFYPVFLGLVLLPGDYYLRHPSFSLQLVVYIMTVSIFRFIHWPIARRMSREYEKINNIIFLISVAVTGLIWGVGFAKFMLQEGEFHANLMMTICTTGLTAGAAVAFIPYFRLGICYSAAMLFPAIFMMAIKGINIPMVIACSLMFIYMCFMIFRGNREYWDALQNEYLLKEKSKDLEKTSRIDGLTELFNRRYFDEVYDFEWQRAIRKKEPITIIMADIDWFKKINDQYGHLAGDEFLKAVAKMLKQVFKRHMDVVARFGGEEFVILMPGETGETGAFLSQVIRQKVASFQLEYENQNIQATLSLGVAHCIPKKNQDPQSLLSKADEALYRSKSNGRNQVTQAA